jgi:flagellar basal-body rod protein FlgF
METGLYVALSSQVALDNRLKTLADNVANMSTVGYRATGISFEDVTRGLKTSAISFTSPGRTYLSDQTGSLRQTQNPFDFAIQGNAWFSIQTPAGQVMTRDGRFTMQENGELVTLEGYPVLDAGGAAIQLNPQNGAPEAGADGALFQDGQMVGALGLFEFEPGPDFRRYGNSGILPSGEPQPVVDRSGIGIVQGFVEEANVNPVLEMTRLIQVQRAFDQVSALMRDSENTLDSAIKTLGGA